MKVKLVFLFLLMAAMLFLLPSTFAAEVFQQTGSLVEIAYVDQNGQIWVTQEDGGNPRQITWEGVNAQPVWSPDGDAIFFIREQGGEVLFGSYNFAEGQEIFFHLPDLDIKLDSSIDISPDGQSLVFVHGGCLAILDIANYEERDLTCVEFQEGSTPTGYLDPVFSPSNQEIAFTQWSFENAVILSIPFEGGDATIIGCCGDPAYAPDSKSLAVSISSYFAPYMAELPDPNGGIYRLILDTGKYEPILTDETNSYGFSSFDFSDDGTRILFERTDFSNMTGQIEIIDRVTGDIQVVTPGYQPDWYVTEIETQTGADPAISHPGWLAFLDADNNVWVVNLENGTRQQVTDDAEYPVEYRGLHWSPDGSHVAFLRRYSARESTLAILDINTFDLQRFDFPVGHDFDWLPDGIQIVFTEPVLGDPGLFSNDGIWKLNTQTGERTKLVNLSPNQDAVTEPDLSPDGKYLLYYTPCFEPTCVEIGLVELESGQIHPVEGTGYGNCSWSPDSEIITCVQYGQGGASRTLGFMDTQGQFLENYLNTMVVDEVDKVLWSPDGKFLAVEYFGINPNGSSLDLIDLQTGERHNLTNGSLLDWVSEDQWILTSDGNTIFVVNTGSGERDGIVEGERAVWQPHVPAPVPTETPTQPPPTQPPPTPTPSPPETVTPAPIITDTPVPVMILNGTEADSGSTNELLGYGLVLLGVLFVVSGVGVYVYYKRNQRRERQPSPVSPAHPPMSQTTSAQLFGISAELKGQTIPVFDGFMIGRGAACNLQLSDPSVSRLHSKLRFALNNWYLQDQGSQGGSYVNGQKVDSAIIKDGDRIQIGDNEFHFRIG